MRELKFSRTSNGDEQELRFYQPNGSGGWTRIIFFGEGNELPPLNNTATILAPVAGSTVKTSPLEIRVLAPSATSVTYTVDGVAKGGLLARDGVWRDSYELSQTPTGSHTIVVTAKNAAGATTTATSTFTTTFVPGTPVNPEPAGSDIAFTKPNAADPNAFVSGSAYFPEVTVDIAVHGVPTKVEWQFGSLIDASLKPEFGWRAMTRVGTTNVWKSTASVDTNYFLIRSGEVDSGEATAAQRAESLFDVSWDMQARITKADNTTVASPRIRVPSANRSPRRIGTQPTWKEKYAYTANYTNMADYVNHVRAAHPSGSSGSLWGKEPQAMEITTDPVAQGVGGHNNHGNVVLTHVPMNYHTITAGQKSSWSNGVYSATNGDQPNSNFRWQHEYPGRLQEGDMVYCGRAIMLANDFPTPTNHLSMGQIYQSNYVWGLAQMLEGKYVSTNHGEPNQADRWKYWGDRFSPFERAMLFDLPMFRGNKWFDIITGVGVSRDVRTGWLEMYTRRPDVDAGQLKQHVWPDGSTRLKIALLQESPPASGGGLQLHDHMYHARSLFSSQVGTSATPVKSYWAKQKIAGTVAEVDPHSY